MKKFTIKFITAFLFIIGLNSNLFAQATISASNTQGCAPLLVTFTALNINANAHRIEWNFNDGSPIMHDTMPLLFSVAHQYNNPGYYYNVTVTSFSSSNSILETVYYSNNIQVNGISINTYDTVCLSEMSNFCVNGNEVNSVSWSFDDGSISNQYCTNHAFSTTGPHVVTVTANSQCGLKTVTKTVYVTNTANPHPNAWTNINTSCPTVPITFNTGTYATYSWNFGDGSPLSNLQNPQHLYLIDGQHTATLTVTNSCGKTGTATTTVTISQNPAFPTYPDFRLQGPSISCPNSNVGFNAPYGYSSYEWHFGDGTPTVTTNNNFNNHTFGPNFNTYSVYVKISSPCGNDTVLYSPLTISNTVPWPTQNFSLGVNSPACPNSNVNFNAPGGYSNYQWDFGDGSPLITTNNSQNNHFYGNVPGSKVVSVKITSACGNDTVLTYILVITNSAPFPNQSWFKLEAGPVPACPNDNVNFNAPNGYSKYEWNFGDNSPVSLSSQSHNNHKYAVSGAYTVSVKVTNGCGNDTILYTTVLIQSTGGFSTQNSWFSLQTNSPSCPNSNVGFQAPQGYNSYLWNFGDGSPLVTSSNNNYNHTYGSSVQTYTVSVKITNGCGHDTILYTALEIKNNVAFPTDSWFKVEGGPNPSCPGDQVNLNAPGGYSNYLWTFGDGGTATSSQNHAGHVYSTVGNYTYSVKITNACGIDTTLYGTISVGTLGSFYSGLSVETDQNTGCENDLIRFRVNQNGFQSYFWNFGDGISLSTTGAEIQHSFSTVGLYTVSCKVKNGCGDSVIIYTTVQITNNSPVSGDLSVTGIQNPSCPGDKVYFVLNDGQSTTKYYWNYGDGSPVDTTIGAGSNHIYTSLGNKTVTVTAVNACNMSKTVTMTQVVSAGPMPSLIGQDGKKNFGYPGGEGDNTTAGCAGDAIIFYFMGTAANNVWDFGDGNTGTATEQMMVDGGDGVFPVTIIKHVFTSNGPYTLHLTITNSCGNSVTDSMKINIGGNQIVNGDMTTSPPPFTTCAPIDFLAFGGSNYAWNFGDGTTLSSSSPTASHTFSTQGVYVVTVLVTNGCGNTETYSKSINVNGAGGPAISLSSSVSPTCVGGGNGSASIAVSNGQEPYSYLWSDLNGQTTSAATNLSAGAYNVKVTDKIGCAAHFQVTITNPAPIVLSTSTTPSGCDSTTGTATVAVISGGTSPYSYLWSNGGTSLSATGLSLGLKSVTVTDFNGCTKSENVSISEKNAPVITLNTAVEASCNGGSNGSLTINVSGGSGVYTYLWSNSATTQNISNLSAGAYSVKVTDGSSCKSTFSTIVDQADSISVVSNVVASPTCGNFDGSASATVTGGNAPYAYLWDSGTNSTTSIVSGLPAGTYTVTVMDAHGCTRTSAVSLSNSNSPNISQVITNVSCFGLSDGAIDVTITGGTSPYLYTWSVPSPQTNNQDLNTLLPGNYVLFVNDAQGCTSVRIYAVTQPALLTASVTYTGATCSSNDGTASVITTGGNSNIAYLWTGGQTNQTATGLSVGSYTVAVTDNRGCAAVSSTTISQVTPTPSICMVTVDELSVNNIIYWDKTPYTQVDSFLVYREVSTNEYKKIGAVAYDSLSEFVDVTRSVGPANGDPNIGAYRYKLRILDNCGDTSAFSLYHNTIYIADNNNGTFYWGLPYAIENSDPNVLNYKLICQYDGQPWFVVGSVSGTQALVNDPSFSTHLSQPNVEWSVKTDWSTQCEPTRAAISTSRSNIKRPGIITGISHGIPTTSMNLYPNPAKENLTIEFSDLEKNGQLKVINMLGQTLINETIIASTGKITKQINISTLSKGIYSVVIENNSTKVIKKLVVN
ncbi:MAG: PKD domain-containing protein [Bacteroidota bacterium]